MFVGSPVTIADIPGGTVCVVTEPTLPTPPEGYHFGDPTFTPSDGTVTIPKINGESVTVTTNNTLIVNSVDLTVSKTAEPAYTLTYSWAIEKLVDQTSVNIADGGSATFNYTVGVTHDDGTGSAWAVSGQITVNNSNNFDVAGVNITDTIDNGGSCSVTDGTNVTVPANSFVTKDYSCTFSSYPGSGTNTATATWDAAAYSTPTGSASGTAGYNFASVTPTTVDECVAVTDSYGGDLGTVCVGDANPTIFTYSRTVSGVAGPCTD